MNPQAIRRMSALVGAGVLTLGAAAFAAAGQLPDDLPEQARVSESATTRTSTQSEQADQTDQVDDGRQDAHADLQADLASDDVTAEADPEANDHGQTVSTFAQETDLEGRERGQAVAELASANRADVTSDEATDDAPVAQDAPAENDGPRATGERASAEGQARAGDDR